MIYLILSFITSAAITIFMRLGTADRPQSVSMLAANYLVCSLLALVSAGESGIAPEGLSGMSVLLGSVNGLLYMLGFLTLQMNVRKNGVVLSGVFMRLGVLVPILMSVIFFRESPTGVQILGFLLALASVVLISFEKEESSLQSLPALIVLLVVGGAGDAMCKVYDELGLPSGSDQFLFFCFATALVLCVILALVRREKPTLSEILYGFLIGIPNYYCARFILKALEVFPAVIVYPTYSIAAIAVVTLAGLLLFHEKLGRRQFVALAGIACALIFLNI